MSEEKEILKKLKAVKNRFFGEQKQTETTKVAEGGPGFMYKVATEEIYPNLVLYCPDKENKGVIVHYCQAKPIFGLEITVDKPGKTSIGSNVEGSSKRLEGTVEEVEKEIFEAVENRNANIMRVDSPEHLESARAYHYNRYSYQFKQTLHQLYQVACMYIDIGLTEERTPKKEG